MILQSKFIDREREMAFLEERYSSERAELVVIYGRRRIGKTYLLRHFLERHKGLYLVAEESRTILEDFSYRIAEYFGEPHIRESPFSNWSALFMYLAEKAENERTLVIIDEVQYAAKAYKEFLSVLQKVWDTHLRNTKIMFILCGSLLSFMEGILSYSSPIYGRRTGAWEMRPIPFRYMPDFHNMDPETCVMLYSVFGGIPQYWSDYDPEKDFWDNIRSLLLSKGSKYYDEPKYLLKQELREVSRYFSILRAISQGYNTFGKIADKSMIERTSLGKYLEILESMGYIVMETPLTGGKRGRYRIKDPLFAFWFRYVFPKREELEMGMDIVDEIREDFNSYVGRVFEEIATAFIRDLNMRRKLPERYEKIGRWWGKGEEIDIVGIGKNILICEVKWKEMGEREVMETVSRMKEKREKAGFSGEKIRYCIVAKRIRKREELRAKGLLLYDLDDITS